MDLITQPVRLETLISKKGNNLHIKKRMRERGLQCLQRNHALVIILLKLIIRLN